MNPRAITVGVDGSEASRQAVRWAAREAGQRGARLLLVHAFDTVHLRRSAGPGLRTDNETWIDDVENKLSVESTAIFDQAVADVAEVDGNVAVETRWDGADPAVALRAASRGALMVVLGWTGSGVLGTALGSVTLAVASHAECPVVVVRGRTLRPDESLPVLVGVDGGPLSDVALAHAFAAASYHGDQLLALHVWSDARRGPVDDRFTDPWHAARDAEERVLAERLAGWGERYPDVKVERAVELSDPRTALVEHSSRSRLVVVATRGRGGFAGLLLGSTGLALIQHSNSPVMLVGPDAARAT